MKQPLLYVFVLLVCSMECTATTKHLPFTENSFNKIDCSPIVNKDIKEGVFFNMPKTMQWGQEVPICGYLKGDKELANAHTMSSFVILIRDSNGEEFHSDSANFSLGTPLVRLNPQGYEMIAAEGELFFNANIINPYTVLAPGDYTVSIEYLGLESERKKLKVISSGWRQELSDFLNQKSCSGELSKNLAEYLQIQHDLSIIDMAPNEDGSFVDDTSTILEQAWHKGFLPYKNIFKDEWRKGLGDSLELDQTVAQETINLLSKSCSASESNTSDIFYLYEGIRLYEAVGASE